MIILKNNCKKLNQSESESNLNFFFLSYYKEEFYKSSIISGAKQILICFSD